MKKIWMLFVMGLLLVLTSCDDVYNRKISLVYDGHDTPVAIYNAEAAKVGTLPSMTEITISDNQNNVPSGYVRISQPTVNALVASKDVRYKTVEVLRTGSGDFKRLPTFPEKLKAAGAPLSAKLFGAIEELHFYKHNFSGILWTIIMVVTALAGWGLLAFGTDEDSYLVALGGVALMLTAYFSGFVLFGVQEPFDDGLKSGGGWFVDLLCFIGVVASAIVMYTCFTPAMQVIIPYTSDSGSEVSVAGLNSLLQWLLLVVYGICLWVGKGAADYVLWAMIGVQALISLYVIIVSFAHGIIIPPLLYTIIYPVAFAFMAVTVLTVGWMVFVLALMIVGATSLLSMPGNDNSEVVGIRITDSMGITLFEDRWK